MARLKTLKVEFKSIKKKDNNYDYLDDCIQRTNDIVFNSYYFVRAYILDLFEDTTISNSNKITEINRIDKDFISNSFRIFMKSSKVNDDKLLNFYNNKYINKTPISNFSYKNHSTGDILYYNYKKIYGVSDTNIKVDSKNLSYVLGQSAVTIITNIENNIKLNFTKYLRQYVNQSFKDENNKILSKIDRNKQPEYYNDKKKLLNKQLNILKNDIINNTDECDDKYKKWKNDNIKILLPINIKNNLYDDIKTDPCKYLFNMYQMNKFLENNQLKSFQFFPLRTAYYNKYITINTQALTDIFINTDYLEQINTDGNTNFKKIDLYSKIDLFKNKLWSMFFKFPVKSYKNYSFNHMIQTDGKSVSISYIHNDDIIKKLENTAKMTEGRKKSQIELKGKSKDERLVIKENNNKIKLEKEHKKKKNIRKIINKKKKETELDKQNKFLKEILSEEYLYIDDLIEDNMKFDELKKIRNNLKKSIEDETIIYADPGKRSLLYMLGENGEYLNISNKWRLKETKRLKYNKKIQKKSEETIIDKKSIKEMNNDLTKYNSKTTDYKKFIEYTKEKLSMRNKIINEVNYNKFLQKLSWFGYINKRRNEDHMINKIKETYGKDKKKLSIVIGDWSNRGKLKFISTPNKSLKKKLKEHFEIYTIYEYLTSKLHHREEKECKNLYL